MNGGRHRRRRERAACRGAAAVSGRLAAAGGYCSRALLVPLLLLYRCCVLSAGCMRTLAACQWMRAAQRTQTRITETLKRERVRKQTTVKHNWAPSRQRCLTTLPTEFAIFKSWAWKRRYKITTSI